MQQDAQQVQQVGGAKLSARRRRASYRFASQELVEICSKLGHINFDAALACAVLSRGFGYWNNFMNFAPEPLGAPCELGRTMWACFQTPGPKGLKEPSPQSMRWELAVLFWTVRQTVFPAIFVALLPLTVYGIEHITKPHQRRTEAEQFLVSDCLIAANSC